MPGGDTAEEITDQMIQLMLRGPGDIARTFRATADMTKAVAGLLRKIAGTGGSRTSRTTVYEQAERNVPPGPEGEALATAAIQARVGSGGIPSVDFKPTSRKNVAFDFTVIRSDPKMTMMSRNLSETGIPFTETFADKEKTVRRFKVHESHAPEVCEMVRYLAMRVPGFGLDRCVNLEEVERSLGIEDAHEGMDQIVEYTLDHGLMGPEEAKEASAGVKAILDRIGVEYTARLDKTSQEESFIVVQRDGIDVGSELRAEAERIRNGVAPSVSTGAFAVSRDTEVVVQENRRAAQAIKDARSNRKQDRPRRPDKDEKLARSQAKEIERDAPAKDLTKVRGK